MAKNLFTYFEKCDKINLIGVLVQNTFNLSKKRRNTW